MATSVRFFIKLVKQLAKFPEVYNTWLIERHRFQPPAVVRDCYPAVASLAAYVSTKCLKKSGTVQITRRTPGHQLIRKVFVDAHTWFSYSSNYHVSAKNSGYSNVKRKAKAIPALPLTVLHAEEWRDP
ncbi:hypothetical protein [Acidocella aminolytica]|uniref:hypothetical protein n=1 Tax=Acidocella aminolytica TaxID=33998 RepID=UPI001114F99F|nr:hypothetical protein [Acidocella aminolytica]